METKQLADTIITLLGGNQFMAMTGAKNVVYGRKGAVPSFYVHFNLPRGVSKDKITSVTIASNDDETYDMVFMKNIRTKNGFGGYTPESIEVRRVNNVFTLKLHSTFTAVTGLDTHL